MFENICNNNNYGNLVDGNWVYSNNTISIFSPTNMELVGTVPSMNKEEIDEIMELSKIAQKKWASISISERSSILHKAAVLIEENVELLSNILQKEISKNTESAKSEIMRTAEFIKFTADTGKNIQGETVGAGNFPGVKNTRYSFITRTPVGTVLAISPFNYPVNLSAAKIAPALMGGNSVILKPPTQGAISALHLVEIFNKAGLPKGVLNTVTGKGSEIGDYLVTHNSINFINFTGSTSVGKHIAVIAGMVPMIMELGGKDAAIVLEDADLNDAAEDIVSGAYSFSGQRCTAIKRVIVLNSTADKLISKLKCKIEKLKVGKPEDGCEITPLINDKAADYVQELINDALNKGAKLILGNIRKGNLMFPTLIDNVTEDMKLAWEEPFGPVLPIIHVDSIDEAITLANKSKYGLQSSVFTKNINNAFYIANRLEVGTVQINNKTERGPDNFPFSGIKDSGIGTQGIKYSIEAMTVPKSIVMDIK